jgi:hypothetical protein
MNKFLCQGSLYTYYPVKINNTSTAEAELHCWEHQIKMLEILSYKPESRISGLLDFVHLPVF